VPHRVVGCNLTRSQSLSGSQAQCTESIAQLSSPQIAAEASALWLAPSATASFAVLGCEARRLLDPGAHTTRHDTAQATGIVHALWIVNETLSSPCSAWWKLVQSASERCRRSADAGTTGTTIEIARAHVAHRTEHTVRMTDLR
jgi:hypothetical protein